MREGIGVEPDAPLERARADAAALRAAGSAHGRSHHRHRHLFRLLRLLRPRHHHRRALALRLHPAEPRLGRGALRLRLAAPPARRRHRARPGQCPLPGRRVRHVQARRPAHRLQSRDRRAAAHVLHQPVAADPGRRRPRLLPALPEHHRPARAHELERQVRSGALPLPAAHGGDRALLCRPVLRGPRPRLCGARAACWPASSIGRSWPTAAMSAATRASPIELLFDLLPLRQMFGAQPRAAAGAAPRHRPHAADGASVPARRRRPRPFQRHGRDSAADQLATLLTYDDMRSQPMQHAPHSGYERLEAGATRCWSPMWAPAPPRSADAAEAHAGCLSFEFSSAAQRIVVNCGTARGAGDAITGPAAARRRPIRRRPSATSRPASSSCAGRLARAPDRGMAHRAGSARR